jgi:LPXTG-motif cell wall-anchored protein
VITKALLGGTVYATGPRLREHGPNRLHKAGNVGVFATDAALLRDGRHVLVRGYGDAEVRTFPGFAPVARFDLPPQEQGEGISVGPGGRIRLSSEGVHAPVLQLALPAAVRRKLAPAPPSTGPTGPPPRRATETDDRGTPWLLPAGAAVLGVAGWILFRRRRR